MKTIMRSIVIAGLLSGSLSAQAAAAPKAFKHTYQVGTDVNTDGQIVQIQPDQDVPPPIVAILDETMKHWSFVPVQQGGKAVPVHSFISAEVEASENTDGKYAIRVTYLGAGPKLLGPKKGGPDKKTGPDYPERVLHTLGPHGAVAVSHLDLTADGKVVVTDIQTDLGGAQSDANKELFAAALKRWYERGSALPETVDGQPIAAKMVTDMTIQIVATITQRMELSPSMAVAYPATGGAPPAVANDLDEAQKAFLKQSGYSLDNDGTNSQSVLKPSMTATVVMQP
ncbi:hypothetical protein [Rhodanobacter sp. C03]|uniref:hypothetical protein n=1 Tax=Rhodanobacter sp. C03 TaxID=1945858 RepID=UPI0009849CAD|nr:hypothetical protein [Rhodanobacter sp. C03]OOG59276.1 hypothetical protein B0E48_00040 [Rhodanobacter sp. C03]